MMAQGIPETEILHEYPNLKPEDIRAALAYAPRLLLMKIFFPCLRPVR